MTELKGTNIASGIVPFTDQDTYPTHYSQFGKGGYRTVKTLEERDNISQDRLEEGMLVYVIEDESNIHTYQYLKDKEDGNFKWETAKFTGYSGAPGISIYDKELLDKIGKDKIGDKYIFIPSESDLNGSVENQTYTTSGNGSYVDILFSAIRQLQIEVAKIRNTFRYGLNSYTGTQTALSTQVGEIERPEDEPLWAVEPDMLSMIFGAEVKLDGTTIPSNIEPITSTTLHEGKISIDENGCYWFDYDNLVKNTTDSKLFLYLTVKKEDNAELNVEVSTVKEDESATAISQNIIINLKNYLDTIPNQDKYNILIILSRITEFGGKNFIWISIGNAIDSKIEGYLNLNTGNLDRYLVEVDKPYTVSKIYMKNLDLFQLDFYSKYQEFTNNVMPTAPSDNDYKYKVAHLTIRSVDNKEMMESIKEQLLENELIFKEDDGTLWIKMKNKGLVSIAGSSSGPSEDDDNDEIMTIEEIIRELKRLGIIYEDGNPGTWDDDYQNLTPGTGNLKISSISDITFVHQATGKKFNFEVDADGELRSTEISLDDLKSRVSELDKTSDYKITGLNNGVQNKSPRGFVSRLHCGEDGIVANTVTSDVGLNSDRVRISSFYMPLDTDVKFGCSHAFIELENTSDQDFPLDDCCLYYYHPKKIIENDIEVEKPTLDKLELKGILPAGSTYLIRGKKYSDSKTNPSTFIEVSDFDIEWYIEGKLIDLTITKTKIENETSVQVPYGFALVYDIDRGVLDDNNKEIKIIERIEAGTEKKTYAVTNFYYKSTTESELNISDYIYPWYYIDSLPLNSQIPGIENTGVGAWGKNAIELRSNTITKNVFALDPAKQALQSLTNKDSSRYRLKNVEEKNKTCDVQYLKLDNPTISFPHSPEEYPITKYTPKSSKQKRNIITDKTSFDVNKPNCVNCSYGIDSHKTRCFNWVSGGYFDEYVWIKNDEGWLRFSSYTVGDGDNSEGGPNQATIFPRKRIFNISDTELIYSRISKKFPGCDIHYTSHKCIIDVVEHPVLIPTTYTYIVGRADKTGKNPDINHCSEEYTFTLYPESNEYKPKIYLTTDQQGFNWIEYQVWSASAIVLNKQIENDLIINNKLIPVLLNSGDMTQNGTRINEWLDYFNGAKPLLKHLEHAAVVGNNDLCGPDPEILGTGDDNGKSNPYYFHIFFCNEINDLSRPIVNNKYIPSNYYFDVNNIRFLMCNSELTITTCKSTFNLLSSNGRIYNIYTGWEVTNKENDPGNELKFCSDDINEDKRFTPLYNIIKKILQDGKDRNKQMISVCHEMPFTVITQACLGSNEKNRGRSLNESNSLVGSHLNQISPQDTKSLYWFSRLCEQYNVKLVLGGHKHTYACTYPVRENYKYTIIENGESINKTSLTDGPMEMPDSLKIDSISFIEDDGKNLSKFPIIKKDLLPDKNIDNYDNNIINSSAEFFYPCQLIDSDEYSDNCVTYFMCQATGYKQTSNKELPSNNQYFSELIPQTTPANKADPAQQYPMYLTIDLNYEDSKVSEYQLKLIRLGNIQTLDYLFTQNYYSTEDIEKKYAQKTNADNGKITSNYCSWEDDETSIIIVKG